MSIIGSILTTAASSPVRIKQINILGLPAFANALFEFCKTFLNTKLRSRINSCKKVEDLSKIMDVSCLPVEYGGCENIDDNLQHFRQKFEDQVSIETKFLKSIQVDEKKMKIYENGDNFETVGSFRKLEID
jgi:hypothetical protein